MKIYEIATPAPKALLEKELEFIFSKERLIMTNDWKSPQGLESVVMFNLDDQEIYRIKSIISDVLIFEVELSTGKSI